MEQNERRTARERALEVLYEADMKGVTIPELVATLAVQPDEFTAALLTAVEVNCDYIDLMVCESAKGWTIDRMPVIDKLLLRLATAELLTLDTPTPVAITEAMELAKRYSTDNSSRFLNGVLGTIAARVRS